MVSSVIRMMVVGHDEDYELEQKRVGLMTPRLWAGSRVCHARKSDGLLLKSAGHGSGH